MATTTDNPKEILDALADAAIELVELVKTHAADRRYGDAHDTLGVIDRLTIQSHAIEDHDEQYGLGNASKSGVVTALRAGDKIA